MGAQVKLLFPIGQIASHWTSLWREEELSDAS